MRRLQPVALMMVVFITTWSMARAQNLSPGTQPATIAVVDMSAVFENVQMVQDLEAIFGEKRNALQSEVDRRKQNLATLQKELASGAFAKDSPDYLERETKLEKMKMENELWMRQQERELRSDHKKYFEDLYKRVTDACAQLAQRNHIDIVMTNNPIDFNVPTSDALVAQILQKKVVYASQRVDLTAAVMAQVDAQYLNDGGAAKVINLAK